MGGRGEARHVHCGVKARRERGQGVRALRCSSRLSLPVPYRKSGRREAAGWRERAGVESEQLQGPGLGLLSAAVSWLSGGGVGGTACRDLREPLVAWTGPTVRSGKDAGPGPPLEGSREDAGLLDVRGAGMATRVLA